MVQASASISALMDVFPPAQRMTTPRDGCFQCNAKAAINKVTRCWEAYDCGKARFARKYDYRRHLKTMHLGEMRAEEKNTQPQGK